MKTFPIQDGPSVPWDYMAPHDKQCRKNHCGQSLEDIASRGGLGAAEAENVVTGCNVRTNWDHLKAAWFRRAERVNRDWGNDKDQPLIAKIEGQQLVIRIGIDVLAFSAEHCEHLYDDVKHPTGPPYCKVINKEELAIDVIRELEREQEDGTTPLHLLLDQAVIDAMEDGSAAFAEECETKQ